MSYLNMATKLRQIASHSEENRVGDQKYFFLKYILQGAPLHAWVSY